VRGRGLGARLPGCDIGPMATLPVDTLDITRKLKAGGFSVEQAETMTDALKSGAMSGFATGSDVAKLRDETNGEFGLLRRDIAEMRAELKRDIGDLKTDGDAKMRDVENRIVIKLGALVAAVAALLFAALKMSA
jgi:hypothetical protein